jgi:hypothetical protein
MTIETVDLAIPQQEQVQVQITGVEATLRKLVLSACTMLGVGYVMVNVPIIVLLAYFWTAIPISSQANIAAIAGRMLFLFASAVSAVLGVVAVFGGVKFFEGDSTRRIGFLGVLLASIYLLCLGIGSTLILPEGRIEGLLLLVAPVLAMFGASTYMVPQRRFKLAGSAAGIVGGVLLAYVFLNLHVWELVFDWGVSFSGPFLAVKALEAITVTLIPVAAFINAVVGENIEGKPLAHAAVLTIALVYGVGVLVGSLVLSMSLWDLVWKSPWLGPLNSVPGWVVSTVVFWSASLFLIDIGGIMLVGTACLGFVFVAREFTQFQD